MSCNEAESKLIDIRKEALRRTIERQKELEKKGVRSHLDGVNYYSDIDEWFKTEVLKIKNIK